MDTDTEPLSRLLNASSGGYELALSAVLMGGIGFLVDRWLGTTPILTVVATIFGFVGAMVSVIYRYKAAMAAAEARVKR